MIALIEQDSEIDQQKNRHQKDVFRYNRTEQRQGGQAFTQTLVCLFSLCSVCVMRSLIVYPSAYEPLGDVVYYRYTISIRSII